jgi:hypothetical protein
MPGSRVLLRIASLFVGCFAAACGVGAAGSAPEPAAPVAAEAASGRGILLRQIAAAPDDAASGARAAKVDAPAPTAFPRDDLKTALRAASRSVRACRTDSGPDEIDATMRFEPTGRVASVDLGPAAGVVAACVKKELSELALMRFDGPAVEVKVRVLF